ncbi:hypothetical protein BDFB_010260 [Asbolus verrucosus]|uniref:Trypsin domain containing protein n=1 Tax=Asbolus verrucosus TaxID=1661398 RepID=A0A482VIR0_ASBVE|nr:hypothetical protein BDFB_010260 [Asbolus verrucosus]
MLVVITDIVLVICLRFVLPKHITHMGYYPADGRKLTFDEAVKFCPCLGAVFPDGTKELISFKMVEKLALQRRKREIKNVTAQQLQHYPFVVSISMPTYSDDKEHKIFVCNGLIQTPEWLVTSKSCVKEETEWPELTVRSGSVYWSKLGTEHSVTNIFYITDDLVALEVWPQFSDNLIPFPPVVFPFDGDWVHAVALGWDDNMYAKTLNKRYKHKAFGVEEWTSRKCSSKSSNVCYKSEKCDKLSSIPLVTSCHHLIGMKFVDNGLCEDFSSLGMEVQNLTNQLQVVEDTACYRIHKDICHVAEMDVC